MSPVADNRRTLWRLGFAAVLMFGFGYAMVPFYRSICSALGINDLDRPAVAEVNTQVDQSRTVTIEFDANTHQLAWGFRPEKSTLRVHPGELVHTTYLVENARAVRVTGQAVPSYSPARAAGFFNKLDCFCFSQQTLAPGEKRSMPLVFVVDPNLPRDVQTITLSYTFFEVPGTAPAGQS
ncbi:MAG: hypothetical protein AMXMBFR6_13130 [Betaproteobacteria bacterium]|nr:cytochrome c oxidase assembly protein [Rhodocyclaceae bacterium]